MVRSILAVATPIVLWGMLWVGTGIALASALPARFSPDGATTDVTVLAFLIVASSLLSVMAGWVCAALARKAFMTHVVVLAALQLAIGIMVQASVWTLMPVWYHVTFLGLVIPMHLLGGRLNLARSRPSE